MDAIQMQWPATKWIWWQQQQHTHAQHRIIERKSNDKMNNKLIALNSCASRTQLLHIVSFANVCEINSIFLLASKLSHRPCDGLQRNELIFITDCMQLREDRKRK